MRIDWRHGGPVPATFPTTLPDLWDAARRRAAGAPVLTADDVTWTWEALLAQANVVAGAWSATVGPGQRVAIMLPNGAAHLIAELATWRLGAIAAPVYPGLGLTRTKAYLEQIRATLVVAPTGTVDGPCMTPEALLALRGPGPRHEPVAHADDVCLLLSTSGSSGQPRAVRLTHGNLCSQQAAYALHWPEVGPGDRLASYLPWHHSFGSLAERLWALTRGTHLTVIPGGGRDHQAFLRCLMDVAPTVFLSVPRMHRVATLGGGLDPRRLRWAFNAGAALPAAEEAWYAQHGIPLYEGWGLTETSPTATLTGARRVPGIVGLPIPGVAVGVREDGHLLVAGAGVMDGYDGDAAATSACLGHDPVVGRWIATGDVGSWTSFGLRLEGRADLTIKLGNGEKVALAAIALALEGCPGVRAATACCRDGETIEALLAPTREATEQELSAAVATVNRRESVPFRRIARAWRLREEPGIPNGLLTPSLKVARGSWLARLAAGEVEPVPISAVDARLGRA